MRYDLEKNRLYITENGSREFLGTVFQSNVYISKDEKTILYFEEAEPSSEFSVFFKIKKEGQEPSCIAKDVVPYGMCRDLNIILLIKNHPSMKSYDRRQPKSLYLLENLSNISLIAKNINHCFIHEKQDGEIDIYFDRITKNDRVLDILVYNEGTKRLIAKNVYHDYRVYHGERDGIRILFANVKTDKWGIVDGDSTLQIYEDNKIQILDKKCHHKFRGNMVGGEVAYFKSESSNESYILKVMNISERQKDQQGISVAKIENELDTQHITVCYNFSYENGNHVDFSSLKKYYRITQVRELKKQYHDKMNFSSKRKNNKKYYHLYFHKAVSKKYFIALELAKKAYKHEIIENEWDWDDSENHIVTYTKDQLYELALMYNTIVFFQQELSDHKIYGIDLKDILRTCETFKGNLQSLYCSPITLFTNYHGVLSDGIEYTRIVEEVRDRLKEQTGVSTYTELQRMLIKKYYEPRSQIISHSSLAIRKFMEQNNLNYKDFKKDIKAIEEQMIFENKIPTRWKSEQELFKLIKRNFSTAKMHSSPSWLAPQHLDVYVEEKSLAFEYQGQQHYQPVEYFGGEDKLQHQLKLDRRKKEKCIENGVKLIEWKYNEPITKVVLNKKMSSLGISINY